MSPARDTFREAGPDEVRRRVRDGYTEVAHGRGSLLAPDPDTQARAFGYDPETLASAPRTANPGLGCGDPAGRTQLRPGDVVLDLGCGAGLDVFIASRAVGPTGRVIGVDMTAALLDRARATAKDEGYENVDFRLGMMEALPVDDSSVDLVVSNCAINLSPEKARVFAEAARVLRPGGRIQISDLIVERELPVEVRASVEAYVGYVGGAITRELYIELVREAGFGDVEVTTAFSLGDVVGHDDPRVQEVLANAGVSYSDAEISEALDGIKALSVSARVPGERSRLDAPAAGAGADPGRQSYVDLLSYVMSNAIAGEIMAVENYSDMVILFDDVDAKLEALDQAHQEGRHIRQLASLGKRLGSDVKLAVIEPEWKAIRATFREAVARGDVAGCLVIQGLMTESMAIVLYRTLFGDYGNETDDLTAKVTGAILADELVHLDSAITELTELRAEDPLVVDDALTWAHPRVMPELFSLLSTSCESLCDELSLDCASLDPTVLGADLDVLRARAATQYVTTLDAVGFPPEISGPLISELASLDQDDPNTRVDCGPAGRC